MEGLAGEVTIRTQDEALPPGGASTGHNCSLCSVFGLLSQRQQGTEEQQCPTKGTASQCARAYGAATRAAGGAVIAAILTFQKNIKNGIFFEKKEFPWF